MNEIETFIVVFGLILLAAGVAIGIGLGAILF